MTAPLPHVAMRLLGDVAYPMRSLVDGNPMAAFTPVLPDGFRWANDDEVVVEHVTLDETVVAKLLFASAIDPATADDDQIRAELHRELTNCHCDVAVYSDYLAQEYGDHVEITLPRMAACCVRAGQLLAGSAATA